MTAVGRRTPAQAVRQLARLAPGERVDALGENAGETVVGVFRGSALVRRYALVPKRDTWLIVREL
jgi:hypothetical protein